MPHNDTRGVLKFSKVIEFQSSCIAIYFSYIYIIHDGKRSFIKLVKKLRN